MTKLGILALGCAFVGLTGCANVPVGLPDHAAGEAVQRNIAVQTVNPAPQDQGPLSMNGERDALQMQRYVTDTVKEPVATSTQSIVGGSGGGGSGGAAAGATP